jgi:hypothetical protein
MGHWVCSILIKSLVEKSALIHEMFVEILTAWSTSTSLLSRQRADCDIFPSEPQQRIIGRVSSKFRKEFGHWLA